MLVVSRNDVNTEQIQEFDPNRRFIKLPIQNYLRLLTVSSIPVYDTINRPQIALINAINNPSYRFACAAFSRRIGKTFIANVIGQLIVLMPGCNVLIISPNYTLSSISFDLQRTLIKHFDLELEKDNVKDKIIELSNGSTIRMGSLSTVDSCVGRSYDLIIFDEAALGKDGEASFNVSLRPTLDRPGAKAIFISTPRGKNNWFSRFYTRGFSEEYPEWVSLQADWTENTRMSSSDVAEAKTSMSKAEFEQEYQASFTSFEGQIYNFNDEDVEDFKYDQPIEVFAGLDPGYRDPTAFCVVAYLPNEHIYWVLDEYEDAETVTNTHAEEIQKRIEKFKIESIFIDSAAAQFAADLAYNYDIATIKAKKQRLEGIAFLQNIIDNRRLKVSPHCIRTLEMLDQYQWNKNEALEIEKPLHDQYSHMADALRYAIYTFIV